MRKKEVRRRLVRRGGCEEDVRRRSGRGEKEVRMRKVGCEEEESRRSGSKRRM